jgi:hypothetical protein
VDQSILLMALASAGRFGIPLYLTRKRPDPYPPAHCFRAGYEVDTAELYDVLPSPLVLPTANPREGAPRAFSISATLGGLDPPRIRSLLSVRLRR